MCTPMRVPTRLMKIVDNTIIHFLYFKSYNLGQYENLALYKVILALKTQDVKGLTHTSRSGEMTFMIL